MYTVYYDTKCCLCSAIITHINDKAQKKDIKFVGIEEFITKDYSNSYSFDLISIDSIILTNAKSVSIYSDAVIQLLISMGGFYKLSGYLIKAIPKVIRDILYRFIAKHRYGIFGKKCPTK